MANRYRNQKAPQMLEIRGLSRGGMDNTHKRNLSSMTDTSFIPTNDAQFYAMHRLEFDSDDDSTLTGGSQRHQSPPQSPIHSEDTITASGTESSSHYWSAGNSFTTGNTTERSSVYSWGDDDFDHQASRMVRQMFLSIEKMLFESVLSESPYLQHECLEWMKAFPHLRILGKQTIPLIEDGVYSLPSSSANTTVTTPSSFMENPFEESSDSLLVSGQSLNVGTVPHQLLSESLSSSLDHSSVKSHGGQGQMPPTGCDLSYLQEEIIEQDGQVEEYFAYDSREMDSDEVTRRYHVPRRRRLGYPPITPNACVHDGVINQLFDQTWLKVVKCITGGVRSRHSNTKTSIIKILFDNHQRMRQLVQHTDEDEEVFGSKKLSYSPGDEFGYGYQNIPGIFVERGSSSSTLPHNFGHLAISNHSRLLFHDPSALPPSRGSYFDQGLGSGRNLLFQSPARLSTAPHGGDMSDLNDVMKISRKKLQYRSDKITMDRPDDIPTMFPSSPNNRSNMYGGSLSSHNIHMAVNGRPTSPFVNGGRTSHLGREIPSAMGGRQASATVKKVRIGKPARLMPLDAPKTPKQFTGMLKTKKMHLGVIQSGVYEAPQGVVGVRVISPQGNPPPTAPASTSNNLWSNPSRLPPISPLESVNENMQTEFRKKNRKISSAIADPDQRRGFEGINRPNTTHTFRSDFHGGFKRPTSVTPSNMTFTNKNAFGVTSGKNMNPGLPYTSITGSSSMLYQQPSQSPENMHGLAGITGVGISMLGHGVDREDDGAPWGHTSYVRRKRTIIGT